MKDLIPSNYIDIHSHLLPGIDDGAKSIEDTFSLIHSLKEIGFDQFITTPHIISNIWENTRESIQFIEKETLLSLKANHIPSKFQAAAEYMMDDTFSKLFKTEKLLTLKDNYVLVEMSYINQPMQLYDILFELQVAGYIPVLAHPERYLFYHNNFEEYKKLKRAGCLFQINLLSTVGYYGKEVVQSCQKLLDSGLIDFTGSDVHHQQHIRSFEKKIQIKNSQPLIEAIKNNEFFRQL